MRLALVALVGLVGLVACVACSKREAVYVAKLESTVAQVERMPREAAPWRAAKVGDTFGIGSAVRTGPDSRARLVLGKTGRLDVDANAVVHFTKHPSKAHGDVFVETGSVEIESGDETFGLVGEVVLEPNTRARLERKGDALTINVSIGNVVLEDDKSLPAGQAITLHADGKPVAAKPAPVGAVTIAITGAGVRSGTTSLPAGPHRLDTGAQLDVPAGSSVELGRDGASAVATGPSTLRVGGSPGALATVSAGTVALRATTSNATIDVPGGSIAARSGDSRATAKLGFKGTRIDVESGETLVRTATGEQTLAAGDSAVLAANGTLELTSRAPATTKLTVRAGESMVLHDPRAPTPVRVDFGGACAGAGVVELAKDRGFKKVVARSGGSGGANVLVPAGAFSYRVRCDGGKTTSGTLRIARDSGRTPLPKAAARTTVEADGREYTILYENLLPELTLTWRNAPASGRFQFVVEANGKPRRIASTSPRLGLPSGELAEGSYRFWVENLDTKVRSEKTGIVIDFNNAAASASLDFVEIKDGIARIRGTVIEGSTVTIGGTPAALDRHRRFAAEVPVKPGDEGIGIRIAHPKLGIHYYVLSSGRP